MGHGVSPYTINQLRTLSSCLKEKGNLSKASRHFTVKGNRYRHVVRTDKRELRAKLGGTAEKFRPKYRIDFSGDLGNESVYE